MDDEEEVRRFERVFFKFLSERWPMHCVAGVQGPA
jgi:hypothetical protein